MVSRIDELVERVKAELVAKRPLRGSQRDPEIRMTGTLGEDVRAALAGPERTEVLHRLSKLATSFGLDELQLRWHDNASVVRIPPG